METQKMCERRHWRGSDVFIVNVEQILYINLMFPLFIYFKQINAYW